MHPVRGRGGRHPYEFDMPRDNSEPMEEYVPGKCPECGAPVSMRLKRTRALQ